MAWGSGLSSSRTHFFVVNNFNGISRFYDLLTWIVFHGKLDKAQNQYLSQLKINDSILILGGGTGKILNEIQKLNISVEIDFIDPSIEMLKKAKSRIVPATLNHVKFHQMRFQEFNFEKKYDWIYCGFFLDLFNEQDLIQNLSHIKWHMSDRTSLIVTDFQIVRKSYWQTLISKAMHLFFKVFTKLESKELKDIQLHLQEAGFRKKDYFEYYSKFIFSGLYKKN